MTSRTAHNPSRLHESSEYTLARIDTTDVQYILPIREFLSHHGCHVLLNDGAHANITYHIIAGDQEYVEAILAGRRIHAQKTLIITWSCDHSIHQKSYGSTTKVVLVDGQPLTPHVVQNLFNFFITSRDSFLILGTPQYRKPVMHHIRHETVSPVTEPEKTPKPREAYHKSEAEHAHRPQNSKSDTAHERKPVPAVSAVSLREKIQPSDDRKRIADIMKHYYESGVRPKPKDTTHTVEAITRVLVALTGGIALACMPFVIYSASVLITGYSLYRSFTCLRSNTQSCMKRWSSVADESLKLASGSMGLITVPLSWAEQEQSVANHIRILDLLSILLTIEKETESLSTLGMSFATTLMDSHGGGEPAMPPAVAAQKVKIEISNLRTNLDLAYATISVLDSEPVFPFTHPSVKTAVRKALGTIRETRNTVQYLDQFLMMYPKLAGFKDKQTYLLLLQNSSELRPTGGFIGSLISMEVADGRVVAINVQDVYDMDGQLKGHVDPPQPVRDLLNQEHWYLRDSNWDPDFRESARKALWFYEKESGSVPHGVIGITSSFVVELLRATGPVLLTDVNDRISADNFFTKSLYYTQNGFFPGSTQKKDFLGSLFNTLTTTILTQKKTSPLALYKAVAHGLEGRDIQMYFSDPEVQTLAEQFGWSGSYPAKNSCDRQGDGQSCVFAGVSFNESNMGVNKTNVFIKRRETRSMTLEPDGTITETITRSVLNNATGEPGSGPYRVYTRIYPEGNGKIAAVTLDGQSIPTRGDIKKTPLLPYGEIIPRGEGIQPVIGLAYDVSPGQERTITLTVKRHLAAVDRTNVLTVFSQKQAGVPEFPVHGIIRFPVRWNVTAVGNSAASTLANPGQLEYNSTMSGDVDVTIRVQPMP